MNSDNPKPKPDYLREIYVLLFLGVAFGLSLGSVVVARDAMMFPGAFLGWVLALLVGGTIFGGFLKWWLSLRD